MILRKLSEVQEDAVNLMNIGKQFTIEVENSAKRWTSWK